MISQRQITALEQEWKTSPRWNGIGRGYSAEDVLRLRGSVHVEHTLARLGYRADVAVNGLEVLEACSNRTYDVVLMDMHMPEMDGAEAARLLRHRFPPDQMPVIVAVTADAMQGDRERCLERGMDYYISKPLRIEDLIQVLLQCRPLAASNQITSWLAEAPNGFTAETK